MSLLQVAAAPGLGKGSLWTVDPQHRASLLQVIDRVRINVSILFSSSSHNVPDTIERAID